MTAITATAADPPSAPPRYSTVAIVLHWLIAALVVFEVGLGLRMGAAHGSAKFVVFQLHKSVGVTILLLMLLRLVWRFSHKPAGVGASGWERGLARAVHILFYTILLALPISGWIIVSTSRIVVPTLLYGIVPWPHIPGLAAMTSVARDGWHAVAEFVHVNLVTIIYGLFALHVAGALKHHFLDRNGGIGRMAPGVRPGTSTDPRLIAIGIGVLLAAGLGRQWLPTSLLPTAASAAALPAAAPPAAATSAPSPAPAPPAAQRTAGKDIVPANSTAPAEAQPMSWTILRTSTLRFRTSWSGEGIDGAFTRFDGDIDFDPDALDRSRVEIKVNTGSAVTGDGQKDETLRSADWFSIASYATATFKADRFRKTGTDRYVASGTLRLKGVTLPISLPFTLRIRGDTARMQGSAVIDRTAYRIGEGEYSATSDIPASVRVEVAVQATRKR